MTFAAPRWGRVIWPCGVFVATSCVVLTLNELSQGETGIGPWFQLTVHVVLWAVFVWSSYLTFCVPSVRIDDEAIHWRATMTKRFQRVSLRDIAGYRMQDSFDLHLRLHSGEERSIHLSQVAKRDRPALVTAIAKIASEGTAAI